MSNGTRHALGFFVGIILTAALAALLLFGTYRLQHGLMMDGHRQDRWIGAGMLAGAAVVFAILAGSRVSPLASLLAGLVFTVAGAAFVVSQKTTAHLINDLPFKAQRVTLSGLEDEGFILFAGVGLLFSSLFPSRWRSRAGTGAGYDEYGLADDESYGRSVPPSPRTGRHALLDDDDDDLVTPARGATSAYGAGPLYDPAPRAEFDTPRYDPDDPYGRRSPFAPPDDDGGTRQMRR